MIILRTNLTKNDYIFACLELKRLIAKRDCKDLSDLDKLIFSLAETGQIEAIEHYCDNLQPSETFNSKIFRLIVDLEKKKNKEPRENLTLCAYYKWIISHNNEIGKKDNYDEEETRDRFYTTALKQLAEIAYVDPISKEYLYSFKKRQTNQIEYLREMSNLRNQIYSKAIGQVGEDKKLKLLNAYAKNLIRYATDKEYTSKITLINNILSDIQTKAK